MFDNSTIEAYRAIKAPESLKNRVMDAAAPVIPMPSKKPNSLKKNLWTIGYAAAACLVVALGSWGFFGGGVSVKTHQPDVLPLSLAREHSACEIWFEIEQRGVCRVSVSCGQLSIDENAGAELEIFGSEKLNWSVDDADCQNARLTVRRFGKTREYTLQQNADSGEWIICPAE